MANRYPLIVTNSAITGDTSPYAIKELPSSDAIRLDGSGTTYNPLIVGAASGQTATILKDTNLNEVLDLTTTLNAQNYFKIENSASGNPPTISAVGDNADISLRLSSKGTNGTVQLNSGIAEVGTGSAAATFRSSGSQNLILSTGGTAGTITLNQGASGEFLINPNGNGVTRVRGGTGGLVVENSSTNDAIRILGRAGGTGSWTHTITPATLSAARTMTLPNANVTFGGAFTTANSFTTTGAFALTLTTTAATTATFPTGTITLADTSSAQTLSAKKVSFAAGAAAAGGAPIKLASGTNLTALEAGTIEYDGTIIWATPTTGLGRMALGNEFYTTGAGTSIAVANDERTNVALFPAGNDNIVLPIGTYLLRSRIKVTRSASTTAASLRVRLTIGAATIAAGTFHGSSISNVSNGGATNMYFFDGVALNGDNVVTASQSTSSGIYNVYLDGILRITTAGNFLPAYSLDANITGTTGSTTCSASNWMSITHLSSSGSAAFSGAWA